MGIFKTVRDTILVKWEKSCINMALIKCHLEHVEFILVFEIHIFNKVNYFQVTIVLKIMEMWTFLKLHFFYE